MIHTYAHLDRVARGAQGKFMEKLRREAAQKRYKEKAPPLTGAALLERETGFEPATSTLARSHSTTELLPLVLSFYSTCALRSKLLHLHTRTAPALHSRYCRPVRFPIQQCTVPCFCSTMSSGSGWHEPCHHTCDQSLEHIERSEPAGVWDHSQDQNRWMMRSEQIAKAGCCRFTRRFAFGRSTSADRWRTIRRQK